MLIEFLPILRLLARQHGGVCYLKGQWLQCEIPYGTSGSNVIAFKAAVQSEGVFLLCGQTATETAYILAGDRLVARHHLPENHPYDLYYHVFDRILLNPALQAQYLEAQGEILNP